MAIMMDNKPTEYKGEALVWEKLYSLLPNDVVIYNHREVVDDREFDCFTYKRCWYFST